MTAITESFETMVEDALFARLEDMMGEGGTYGDPFYLQVKTLYRAAGEPVPQLPEGELPVVWIEYVGGVDRGAMVGSSVGMAQEVFMIYGRLAFTPKILELAHNDKDLFVQRAKANAGVWARRIRQCLLGWSPGVICPVSGQKTMRGRPTAYGLVGMYISDFKREFTVTLRWELEMEP